MLTEPVASEATTATPTFDSLANHPEWRVPESDVASGLTAFKHVLTQRGVAFDSATVAAYRVPTVDGWTTFFTDRPSTMRVRPNPHLLERTPEGVTPLSPTAVALNYGAKPTEMAVIEDVQRIVAPFVGIDPDPDLEPTIQQIKDLIGPLDVTGVDAAVAQVLVLLNKVRDDAYDESLRAVQRIEAALDRPLPDPHAVIQQIIDTIGPLDLHVDETITAAEEVIESLRVMDRIGDLITLVRSIDPMEFVNQIKALVDSLPVPSVDPNQVIATITNLVNKITLDGLALTKTDLDPTTAVFEVVPIVAAAPPDVANDIMVNPNVPQPLRPDDENDPAQWTRRNSDCFHVITEYYDRLVCWRIDGQDRDNDAATNYWQLHTDSSGHSMQRKMARMWIEAKPSPEGQSNQRFDAIPEPRSTYGGSDGCNTSGTTFTISSGSPIQVGFGWYWERTTCETYTPKTYSDDGHWASIWEGNDVVNPNVQRYVMLKNPVKTPSDKGVSWDLLTGQTTKW